MGRFFEPDTPLFKKVLAFIILPTLAASMGVIFIDFLPSTEADRWGKLIASILTLVMTLYLYCSHKQLREQFSYQYPKTKIRLAFYAIGIPIGFYLMLYTSFSYTFPRIAHALYQNEAEKIVTISEMGHGSRKGYYFNFTEYDYLWWGHSDHIRKELWTETQTGDQVLLRGTQSSFGFVIQCIDKYPFENRGKLIKTEHCLRHKWMNTFFIVASFGLGILFVICITHWFG